jgi:glutathione S-transferase
MKLYYSKGACSLAPRIAINELQLDCKYETVDFNTNLIESGDNFFNINQKGSIPALRLPAGEIITETAIILQYLADLSPQGKTFIPREMNLARYRVLECINFVASDLHQTVSLFFNSEIPTEIKNSFLRPKLDKKLAYIEKVLSNSSFFTGDTYTFADSYLFVVLSWCDYVEIDRKIWPKINSYFENLKLRPAIAKSLEEEK